MQKMVKVSGDTGKIGDMIDVVLYNGELDEQFLQALKNHPHGFTYGLPCIYNGTMAIGMKIDGRPHEEKVEKGQYIGFFLKGDEHDALLIASQEVIEREYVPAHAIAADGASFAVANARFITEVHAPAYEELSREIHLAEALSTDQPMVFNSEPPSQENFEAAARMVQQLPMMDVYTHKPLQVHAAHYTGGYENQAEIIELLIRHGFNATPSSKDIVIFLDELVTVEPGQVVVLEDARAWTTTVADFLQRYEIVSR